MSNLNKESLQNFVLRMEQATAEANIIMAWPSL